MSQSKDAVELCSLLVDETYGELASRIFAILQLRGRLQIQNLAQHTRLNRRQLRHGLVVLIQQNLVYYFEDEDEVTYYEANQGAAYGLIRSGKILEVVGSRYGTLAQDVVQQLFLLGRAKVGDLADSYKPSEQHTANGNGNGNGVVPPESTNGEAKKHTCSPGELDSILCDLLQAELVEPVTGMSFRSPDDTYNEIEREILRSDFTGGTKGPKQKEELKRKIRDKLESLRAEARRWDTKGNKRPRPGGPVNGANGSAKRRSLSNGAVPVNGDHAEEEESLRLERDLVVRINYEKCVVALRSQRLAEFASHRIGETTSHVYAELLRLLEARIPRCQLDPQIDDVEDSADGPTITTLELAAAIGKSVDVGSGIGKAPGDKIDTNRLPQAHRNGKRKLEDFEAEVEGEASEDEDESEEDNHGLNGNGNMPEADNHGEDDYEDSTARPAKRAKVTFQDKLPRAPEPQSTQGTQNLAGKIKNHLQLLAADACHLLRRCGSRGQGEWTVDFERLIDALQESEIDSILMENFETTGLRLARMLRKMGKLDEKQLSGMALMKQKDVRTKLAEMQSAGMADIQEVPKDATRANNRTIFLWHFDSDRVKAMVVQKIYKTMARCLQRLEIEKRRSSGILALSERTDVKDNEEALSGDLLNKLRAIQGKEHKIHAQLNRLDELIGTFQDY